MSVPNSINNMFDNNRSRRHKCPPKRDCACCNIFNVQLGDFTSRISTHYATVLGAATPAVITERGAIAQNFYLSAIEVAESTYANADVSPKCCKGFAISINNGYFGIYSAALSLLFNPNIPLGTSSDVNPGTVYGNIYVTIQAIAKYTERAMDIATCCEDEEDSCGCGGNCRKCRK
jgi:hypothetical protein